MSSADPRHRGARELRLPDWPYGAVGRRLVLEALLLDDQPEDGWTKAGLERSARSGPGGVDGYLAGVMAWGIAAPSRSGKWQRVDPAPQIVSPLEELLALTREAAGRAIPPIPRRRYARRR